MPRRKRSIVSGYRPHKIRDRKVKRRSEREESRLQEESSHELMDLGMDQSSHELMDPEREQNTLHGESSHELMDLGSGPQGESSDVRNGLQEESSHELMVRSASSVSHELMDPEREQCTLQGESSHELMDLGCSQNM